MGSAVQATPMAVPLTPTVPGHQTQGMRQATPVPVPEPHSPALPRSQGARPLSLGEDLWKIDFSVGNGIIK